MMPNNLNSSMNQFRWTAFLEGWSFILLLFVAMPLKYFFNIPMGVKILGMAHGLLFVLFVVLLLLTQKEEKWSLKFCALAFISSLIPFGTFWLDKKYFATAGNG